MFNNTAVVSSAGYNFNWIIASSDPMIDSYANRYTYSYDDKEDLKQKIRVKIWTSIQHNYSTVLGTLSNWVKGVIRLESKKEVLDKPKYKQRFFEDTLVSVEDLDLLCSNLFVDYLDNINGEQKYEEFIGDFYHFLNGYEKKIFDARESSFCSNDSIVLFALAEELGITPSTLYLHANTIEKKLKRYAISRGFQIK